MTADRARGALAVLRLSLHTGAGKHLHGGRTAFYGGYADESADALFGG